MSKSIDAPVALEAVALHKRFGAVIANKRIDLVARKGSVHGIVGENGAGKSTLLNMLFGFYQPDDGVIKVFGEEKHFASAADGIKAGIGMVHQHFMLVDPFTVLENLVLALDEPGSLRAVQDSARQKLEGFNRQFGFHLNPDQPVEQLSVGEKQRLEIVKALSRGADILILDEPTAVLTPQECDQLFQLVAGLREDGKTILFVTHKLNEILAVTDRVTVIRQGEVVAEVDTAQTSAEALAEAMVGSPVRREVDADIHEGEAAIQLVADGVSTKADAGRHGLKDIALSLHAGEVLGIAGVAGNGQAELMEVLTGMRPVTGGRVSIKNHVAISTSHQATPKELREDGLAHIPEDRLRHGVVAGFSAEENAVLGYSHRDQFVSSTGVQKRNSISNFASTLFESQDIRPRAPHLPVGSFSGGNQQKLVIARELAQEPEILIIGQPTRGVDIGAVTLIHDQIIALRNAGRAILLISADLDELLTLSDRVMVMAEGRIVGEMAANTATPQQIGMMMAGSTLGEAHHG